MSSGTPSCMADDGNTKLKASLLRAKAGGAFSMGQWLQYPGHHLASTVASLGPDWVLVDCEHGAVDDSSMHMSVKAIAAAHSSPIVRIAGPEPHLIKRAPDAGAHGIMIPMVETQAQAELIARAAHYPDPASGFSSGTRGTGGLFASLSWGMGMEYGKYSTSVNEKLVVIVQIETPLGVASFIGPNDLCASMGFLGRNHADMREVQEAGDKVLKAAKEAGKFAGCFCLSAEQATARVKNGWEFVNRGADIVAVMPWMGSEMGKFKKMTGDLNQGNRMKIVNNGTAETKENGGNVHGEDKIENGHIDGATPYGYS